MEVLVKYKLFLHLIKYKFNKQQIKYLGLVILEYQVEINLVKIARFWD